MVFGRALNLKLALVALFSAASWMAASAQASPTYNFETLDNQDDPSFNQLLGISSTPSPTIVGYFGDGVVQPNKGYTIASPYGQTSYSNENFPISAQTQVTGVEPNNPNVTVGFYMDAAGNSFGFVDNNGSFTKVVDPNTPVGAVMTDQLLGVNDNGLAVGFYVDANGSTQGFTYNIATQQFAGVILPASFNAMDTTAAGINDAGVITGFYTDAVTGNTLGFVDNNNVFSSFSDPSGTGADTMFLGINSSDEIVGSYMDAAGVTNGLVFNDLTDVFQTVNDPLASPIPAFDMNGTTINGINNAGDLVGFYSDGTNIDGFLATPVTPTPEPTMLGLLLVGGAVMIRKYARKTRRA